MIRRNLCKIFVLFLMISCALATDEKEKVSKSDKKDEKSVSKRGILHYANHGHVHPAIVSGSHYHLPPAVPTFAKYPVHAPAWPAPIPVAPRPAWPAPATPHYHIAPGGASVTSYSVNYPRVPFLPQPVVPFYHKPAVQAFAPPVLAPALPAAVPACHHHHHQVPAYVPHYHSTAVVPNYLAPRPQVIPVAVPFPGIRHPKYPVYFNQQKPVFAGLPPQYIPFASPNPTFIPIAVPTSPLPAHPPAVNHPGTAQDTNIVPATQEFPQILMPTQPTFVQQPTQPTMTSHGWRPFGMMTQHHHHPQATQPTLTNKQPYNYHAPAIAFNHDEPSSTNDIISGHGQMSGQLAHQLALYQHLQHQRQHEQQQQQQQHQQHQQYVQQQENSFPYPAAAETFSQNYDQPSNAGQYQGLSSYQVPVHH